MKGKVVFHAAFGQADLFAGTPMTAQTFFDLASLTKPLATTLALMRLVEDRRLDLDQPVVEILPSLDRSGKQKITARHLLTHTSGLPSWRPWFIHLWDCPRARRREELHRFLIAEPLETETGEVTAYSDLGFMLLAWIIEEISGQRLDHFVNAAVYDPLGIEDLFYLDRWSVSVPVDRFAATQLCPWRQRLLKGQVDDDNTWAMGGIGGQAGLFGTAIEVSVLAETLRLTAAGTSVSDLFTTRNVNRFFERQASGRALGFDVPNRTDSSTGHYLADSSVGHLGHTGTSFWIDPEKALVVTLLTNRVHPFRFSTGIQSFRPRLHDTVVQELGLA
ncbi:MAG: beta-lactamase family protein [Desulfobacterales bacterium]|nr:beta-lactamase family protein [Desulfobacterales bacterium]